MPGTKRVQLIYPNWQQLDARTVSSILRGEHIAPPEVCQVVYEREVDADADPMRVCNTLFEEFNVGDHGGRRDVRSMSVGDQVRIGDETYVCASIGWERVGG